MWSLEPILFFIHVSHKHLIKILNIEASIGLYGSVVHEILQGQPIFKANEHEVCRGSSCFSRLCLCGYLLDKLLGLVYICNFANTVNVGTLHHIYRFCWQKLFLCCRAAIFLEYHNIAAIVYSQNLFAHIWHIIDISPNRDNIADSLIRRL